MSLMLLYLVVLELISELGGRLSCTGSLPLQMLATA